MSDKSANNPLRSLIAASTLLFSATVFASGGGGDDGGDNGCTSDCGYERGPDPTESFLEASEGPYNVSTDNVPDFSSDGFGGGTVHYPTDAEGTMAAVVVIPGFVSAESSIEWWGPKLASHGFVVMTIDTNSGFDQPGSRATQINNALDYLVEENDSSTSPVSGMIDPGRLGVIGWSMGGGGTLRVASEGRIQAAIPLAPWDSSSYRFRDIETPTMIIACESDIVAPVRSHADPFYDALPDSTDKAFVEMNNGDHYCGNGDNSYNDELSRFGISWMKLHLDQDERYDQFLCGPDHESDWDISEHRSTCPY
ncbi:MAG: alpha/beta hydrolase family protein [Marinobacter sp.]